MGENTAGTDDKNAPSNSKENPQKSQRGKNRFRHTKPGKRWPSDVQKNNSIEVKFFSPNPPARGSKNVIVCFLANMR